MKGPKADRPGPMNKSDLIATVAAKLDINTSKAASAVDCLLEAMTAAMARGERIEIRNFGSWVVRQYGARVGRNPRTGETVSVQAKRLPNFKPGKDLADRIMAAGQREQVDRSPPEP